MKLATSVLLSIVVSMAAVDALVIPQSFEDLPVEFSLSPEHVVDAVKNSVAEVISQASDAPAVTLLAKEDALPLIGREETIQHGYIVLLKDGVSQQAFDFQKLWVQDAQVQSFAKLDNSVQSQFEGQVSSSGFDKPQGGIKHVYDTQFLKGYSGFFTPEVAELIRRHPDVASVEVDSTVHALESATQVGAPWGLSRVSHREKLGLGNFNQYLYDAAAGEGVTAYVIDTGVHVTHNEFEGRALWGATIPENDEDEDGNGHGTHCAGTIASKTYGLAKNAKVVAVKVLRSNGSGSMSDVVKGVEFAANSHLAQAKDKNFKGSTANMSLGGGKSPSLDRVVNAAVKAGIHFAVAAGNENQDACNTSPAGAEGPVTVGASTLSDTRAYFSNYGTCVDLFAPGLNILSTYTGSDTATAVLSGTSMASPHVCGLMTYFLSLQPEDSSLFKSSIISPEEMKQDLIKFGTKGALSDVPSDTPNVLIFNGAGKDLSDFWNASGTADELANSKPVDVSAQDKDVKDLEEDLARTLRIAESAVKEELKDFKEIVDSVMNQLKAN